MSPANASRPLRAPARTLPADRVHAWRMERQLFGIEKADTPAQVATRLIGVQAQVTSSAALAIALRSRRRVGGEPAVNQTAAALRNRDLVRSWAMRGTLHLFAADDVPTIAAAMGGKENWRRPAWLRWFGVTELEMERLIDGIGDVLDDGRPRTRAELAEEIGARMGPKVGKVLLGSWGSAIKIASDRDYICQSSEDDAGVRFVKASRWIGTWREEDPDRALAVLVERYLAAYGPATQREILRWWGMSLVTFMKPLLAGLGAKVTEIEVDGTRAYVRAVDLEAIEATRPTRDVAHLVGGFDPFIVGAGLRDGLLAAAHLKRVSRTAGWISPVVLLDGVAAGVWDHVRSGDRLTLTVEPFGTMTKRQKVAVGRAAERVGEAYASTVSLHYGHVFPAAGVVVSQSE